MIEKIEKAGKIVAAITAIVGAVVGLTSWATHKLVIEPLQDEIEDVRQAAALEKAGVKALNDWMNAQEQQSRTSADVLRDRLGQHEVAMTELRGTIEALRIELRYARGLSSLPSAGASSSTSAVRHRSIEDVRAASDSASIRSTAAIDALRGDPLAGLDEL